MYTKMKFQRKEHILTKKLSFLKGVKHNFDTILGNDKNVLCKKKDFLSC